MPFVEFFVRYVQRYIPTSVLRFFIWLYIRVFVGWRMRSGDVIVEQIRIDRSERKKHPVTTEVEAANEQLYANDPDFFEAHLGKRLKYSACEWPSNCKTIDDAEEYTIKRYQTLANLESLPSGAYVLELGCGWGSLSLTNAEKYPHLNFVSFSNSEPQIKYIKKKAAERGIKNLECFVEDYADFVRASKVKPGQCFDVAFAIETIEHAQNISELLDAVSKRLKKGGKLFVHSLLHQSASYFMSNESWMGRQFFTGGSIISLNSYFHLCPPSLRIDKMWPISGIGYSKTLLAWYNEQEKQKHNFRKKYGNHFYEGFRMFYLSCAEAFAANRGAEYMCGYYLFETT